MLRYVSSPTIDPQLHYTQSPEAEICTPDFIAGVSTGVGSLGPVPTAPAAHPNPLAVKMALFADLAPSEVELLESVTRNVRTVHAEQVIVHEGSRTDHICLLVEGLAYRYKMLSGGRRQILGYLVAGDLCDTHFTLNNRPDHSLAAVCNSKIVRIPIERVAAIIASYPRLAIALSLSALVDSAILREWLVNVGQRDAVQRLGHFLCEMESRFRSVGRVDADGSFDLPVNQTTLADTIGATPVHTNRILQRLRQAGLICLSRRRLTILDRQKLVNLAGFDDNYLRMRVDRS